MAVPQLNLADPGANAVATRAQAQTIEVNKLNLQYREWGDPRTKHALILLHGYGETAAVWEEAAGELAREYRVIAIDQRGHGGSQRASDHNYSRTSQVEDLETFIEALALRTVTLIGHGMGGANALCYAAEHPEVVSALVVIEAAPEVLRTGVETMRRLFASAEVFTTIDDAIEAFQEFYPYATQEQLARRVRASLAVTAEGSYAWDFDPIFRDATARPPEPDPGQRRMVNLWDCVERVQCPVMIVRGSETDMLTPEAVQRLHRRIPGSRVSLIEEAGHAVPSDQPAALGQHIREFLQSLTSGPT
jgi:pimeloyl-ACP methyl ester carboxylesterase